MGVNPIRRYKAWKFRRALDRLYAQLPAEWKALSEAEQDAEIDRIVKEVRAERRARELALTNSATVTETEATL